ncbi:MAG: TolC family protein [Thermodesulfovibrio sp.]|nr:TolC family protein [Thermodesulfovibrio sp.]
MAMNRYTFFPAALFVMMAISPLISQSEPPPREQVSGVREVLKDSGLLTLTLQECVDVALENNHARPASKFAVEIAEAQHLQALSSYWPQVALRASFNYMDEDPNFIFPTNSISLPASAFNVNTPLGPLPVNIPAQSFNLPEQNVKLMNKSSLITSLSATYPLYTGGLREAIARQARSGLEAAKQDAKRTDLQVIFDVKRMYYGALLAGELYRIGRDAMDRMEVTLELTEKLYKSGSGKVKKTDYLRNKSVVEGLRTGVFFLKANEDIAIAALTNAMGLDWNSAIKLSETNIPFFPYHANLRDVVSNAYLFNPDWARLQEGLKAAEARLDAAKSGHLPKIAMVGNLINIQNSYDKGLHTPDNKNAWSMGLVLELPLFNGFRTQEEIREARARLGKLAEEKILLREGIALQVKYIFTLMISSGEQEHSAAEAAKAADENRDLHERAYREDLVETKDVIEAQLVESFMKAQHQKILYDHVEAQARLDFVVGKEINKLLYGQK